MDMFSFAKLAIQYNNTSTGPFGLLRDIALPNSFKEHIMNKKLLSLSIAGALSFAVGCANAENEGTNVEPSAKVSQSAATQSLDMAAQLEALGREQQDALLLAAALRLQQAASVETEARSKQNEEEGNVADKEGQTDLLALAQQYAGENEALQAVVAMANEDTASRGRVGGAVRGHVDRVRANTTDVYEIEFRGDREAEVYVRGDGDTDLVFFF